jgi:HK97 gp10 family phage protein
MAVTNGIRIDGLDELRQTLDELAPREAFNLMRGVTLGVAREVRKRAAAAAPVGDGTLKRAIKAKRGNPRENAGKPFADVYIETGKGAPNDAFYWRFIEYGTKAHGNHPGIRETHFMRSAIEAVRPQIDGIMREQFGKKLEALLKRKAKKQANG